METLNLTKASKSSTALARAMLQGTYSLSEASVLVKTAACHPHCMVGIKGEARCPTRFQVTATLAASTVRAHIYSPLSAEERRLPCGVSPEFHGSSRRCSEKPERRMMERAEGVSGVESLRLDGQHCHSSSHAEARSRSVSCTQRCTADCRARQRYAPRV